MSNGKKETYDIVLANGRVIDPETYMDATMYVGINGGSIAAVSETPLEGKRSSGCQRDDRISRIY
jgi:N-acyl-D-glutamate deacylase